MFKRKYIQAVILSILMTFPLTAEEGLMSYETMVSHLSSEQKEALQNEGEVTLFHFDEFETGLLPFIPQRQEVQDLLKTQDMNMGIEGLFLNKDFSIDEYLADPEKTALHLYNTIRSVSTLEGTQYYSASRGEMRDLFVESWIIPDLDSPKEKIPDSIVSSIPAKDSILIHQKDKSFGKNESLMEFSYESPVITAVIINKTSMFYNSLIRVIKPERMQMHLIIIPTEKGILFYGITAADTLNIKAFRKRANNSFYNRVKALYQWYSTGLEK